MVGNVDSVNEHPLTFPFRRAGTIEPVLVAGASAPVAARVVRAIIDGAIGGVAHVAGIAHALRPVRVLHADAVRGAGGVLAQTPQLAVAARVPGRAVAVVRAHVVHAVSPVLARVGQALVQVQLAVLPLETVRAVAYVAAVVVVADAVVQARVGQALVDVHLAARPLVPAVSSSLRNPRLGGRGGKGTHPVRSHMHV